MARRKRHDLKDSGVKRPMALTPARLQAGRGAGHLLPHPLWRRAPAQHVHDDHLRHSGARREALHSCRYTRVASLVLHLAESPAQPLFNFRRTERHTRARAVNESTQMQWTNQRADSSAGRTRARYAASHTGFRAGARHYLTSAGWRCPSAAPLTSELY